MLLIHTLAAMIGAVLIFLTLRGDLVLQIDGHAGALRYTPGYAGAVVLISATAAML